VVILKVLVTGGAGYIGSTLIPVLLDKGYKVVCLDRLFFGKESLAEASENSNFELQKDDVRWFDPRILKDVDTVVDLAALSNDPSGELDPAKTLDINYLGRVRVARLSKEYGVRRYILASSCSVYGFQTEMLTEESAVNPLTTYAKANVMAEKDILPLGDSEFTVTAVRLATVYGLSRRMRFDLAVNGIVLGLYKTGKIQVMRDGSQWRPFIHVKDVAVALTKFVENSPDEVNRQVFNTGSDDQNYQIYPLAELIGRAVRAPFKIEWYGTPDKRSYRVSFRKIKEKLNFTPRLTPSEAAEEIYNALKDGGITDSMRARTVDWYKHLLDAEATVREVMLRNTVL